MSNYEPPNGRRCRCKHRPGHHLFYELGPYADDPSSSAAPYLGACKFGDCPCSRFEVRAAWSVKRDRVDALTVAIPGPWRITSPRGVEVIAVRSQPAAIELAHSLAAIEEMLARLARLERSAFGPHPALRAPARHLVLTREMTEVRRP